MVQKFKPSSIDWDEVLKNNGSCRLGQWFYCKSIDSEVDLDDEEWVKDAMKKVISSIKQNLTEAKDLIDRHHRVCSWEVSGGIYQAFKITYKDYTPLFFSLISMGYECDYPELMFGKLWEEAGL